MTVATLVDLVGSFPSRTARSTRMGMPFLDCPEGTAIVSRRKAAARRLAEAGCTAHEIAAITAHASLREIVRYTKAVDQARLAVSAMNKTE